MKKIICLFLLLVSPMAVAEAQTGCVELMEIDGSPDIKCVRIIRVTNGTLTRNGSTGTITISGGGGGTPGGADTNVQYNDSGSFGGVAGFVFDKVSKVSLGVAGASVGAIGFRNATSGTVTLEPVTGALGAVTLSLPAVTDTLVGLAATQALTNKTINGLTITSTTGTFTIAASKTLTASNTLTFTGTDGSSAAFGAGGTVAYVGAVNAWADGVKQTFNPDATNAGINVGLHTADPSTLANGDIWYATDTNALRARINGATVSLGAGGGGGYATIQEEGTGLTQRTTLNFVGSSFTAADDTTRTNVTSDSDLDSLASNSTNGLWARTGAGTGSARTLTAGNGSIIITNGDGVSGNPTISTAQNITTLSTPEFASLGIGTPAPGAGITVVGATVTTQANNFIAAYDGSFTVSKNDANTRTFRGHNFAATLNTGASNANTTLNMINVDTVNTATTGLTTNLLRLAYGGTQQFLVTSGGVITNGTLGSGAVLGGVTVTLGSDATGDTYHRNASGVLTRLAVGATSADYIATSTGLPAWQRKVYSVRAYGAVCDGSTTDDRAAIQGAIDAAGSYGIVSFAGCTQARINSGLTIGNGSGTYSTGSGTTSTINDVTIDGANARINWHGSAGGTVFTINGPISRVKIRDIYVDAKPSTNAAGLVFDLNHPRLSEFSNIYIENGSDYGVRLRAYGAATIGDGANSNIFDDVVIASTQAGAKGFDIGYTDVCSGCTLDPAQNVFRNIRARFDTGGGSFVSGSIGIRLNYTDASQFDNVITAAATGLQIAVPGGTGGGSYPAGIQFNNPAITGTTSFNVSGTWTATDKIGFYNYQLADGQTVPGDTANTYGFDSDGNSWGQGNIGVAGTSKRFTADLSSGTDGNRFMFQTSAANSATYVGAMPSGTGVFSGFRVYSGSDPNNASVGMLYANGTFGTTIESNKTGSGTTASIFLTTNTNTGLIVDTATTPNVVIGTAAALATSATDGFLHAPSAAGVPTGTPTSYTGKVPLVIDTTNQRVYGYISSAWRNLTGSGGGSSPPFADNTDIIKDDVDATKLLRFSIGGFSSGVTRTLTPQNADYQIAGINLAQTFTSAQTFNSTVQFNSAATFTNASETVTVTQAATTGAPKILNLTGGAHTSLTGNTEVTDLDFNLARTMTWTTTGGAFATQRSTRFRAPTLAGSAATETITSAINVEIDSPVAGSNMTLTDSIALHTKPSATGHTGIFADHQSGATGAPLDIGINGTKIVRFIAVSGSINSVFADIALATNATDNFIYYPSMAGAPTGVPTSYTGTVATVFDTTNSKLYARLGGAWSVVGGSNVVFTNQANTYTTGAQSFASATSLTVPTSAGAAPTTDGQIAYDTTADMLVAGQSGATIQLSLYDIAGSVVSKPGVSQVVLRFVAPRAFNLPTGTISNGTNAPMKAGTSATAQADFLLQKNGSTICTLRFAAAGAQATYQSCTATDFAVGDVVTLVAPSTQDSTLADIGYTFPGKLK